MASNQIKVYFMQLCALQNINYISFTCWLLAKKYFRIHLNGHCHGPAGVPRLATRCLCVLSTWLVVCLVPCAPMSIVCPLPSCYLIIVSVAPAVSPSFVSLYSSPCVCSLVLIRCLSCVVRYVSVSCWLCSSFMPACLPACLFFPFGVVFVVLCFVLLFKNN